MSIALVETRKISGKGILRVPPDAAQSRYYVLYTEVIRLPSQPYLNFSWNPPKSRYGTMCFMFKGTVLKAVPLEFERQSFIEIPDIAGQVLIALKCVLDANNQSIINLGLSLPRPPISVNNPITEYLNLDLVWDEIRVCCYADSAIQLRLYASKYDSCKPDYNTSDSGGEPPLPPEKIPAGVPLADLSKPYDESTNDDGNTEPLPLDEIPVEPSQRGVWTLTYTLGSGGTQSSTYQGFSDDVFAIQSPSPNCNLSGSSRLLQNGEVVPFEDPFNCNPQGFVSVIVNTQFTPD